MEKECIIIIYKYIIPKRKGGEWIVTETREGLPAFVSFFMREMHRADRCKGKEYVVTALP